MKKRIVLLCLTLALLLCAGNALALVKHTCGRSDCICFIQYGDKGLAVSGIIDALYKEGFLASDVGSIFTQDVEQAVKAFQKSHKLTQDGKMTDNTMTWLLWGMSVTNVDKKYPNSDGQEVWVSTDGGTKFHSNPTCSKMAYARKLSARNAQALGFTPCRKCWSY
ncbi:MAG: peptidoglycan-binding protein [Clostridia bacterium]|nr:peptidoglycan-binding protein [Clostridia bacterium]